MFKLFTLAKSETEGSKTEHQCEISESLLVYLFISKKGEKKNDPRRWDVWPADFFFYYDQMKITQRSLSLSTHCLLCFGRTGLEEKPDPVRVEIRAGHPTPLRGPTVLGNAPLLSSSPVSLSLSLASLPPSLSLSFPPSRLSHPHFPPFQP